jgi:hypothetical protein
MTVNMAYPYKKAGAEGTHKREVFMKKLSEDLSKASKYPDSLFSIVAVAEAPKGTTTAEVEILPNKAKWGGSPQQVAEDIALQVRPRAAPCSTISPPPDQLLVLGVPGQRRRNAEGRSQCSAVASRQGCHHPLGQEHRSASPPRRNTSRGKRASACGGSDGRAARSLLWVEGLPRKAARRRCYCRHLRPEWSKAWPGRVLQRSHTKRRHHSEGWEIKKTQWKNGINHFCQASADSFAKHLLS